MKRLMHHLQTLIGATRGEVIVMTCLLCGLLLGHGLRAVQHLLSPPLLPSATASEISRLLDSLSFDTEASVAVHDSAVLDRRATVPRSVQRSKAGDDRVLPGSIDLNSASKTRLMTLPGVGEATAERIIDHRVRSRFRRPEDLMLVKGIGEKRYERMRPYIVVP